MQITRTIHQETKLPTNVHVTVCCETDIEATLLAALLRHARPEDDLNLYNIEANSNVIRLYPKINRKLDKYEDWCRWAETEVERVCDSNSPLLTAFAALERNLESRTEFLSDQIGSIDSFTSARISELADEQGQRLDAMQTIMEATEQSLDDLKARLTTLESLPPATTLDTIRVAIAELSSRLDQAEGGREILNEHIRGNHTAHRKLREIIYANDELLSDLQDKIAKRSRWQFWK